MMRSIVLTLKLLCRFRSRRQDRRPIHLNDPIPIPGLEVFQKRLLDQRATPPSLLLGPKPVQKHAHHGVKNPTEFGRVLGLGRPTHHLDLHVHEAQGGEFLLHERGFVPPAWAQGGVKGFRIGEHGRARECGEGGSHVGSPADGVPSGESADTGGLEDAETF